MAARRCVTTAANRAPPLLAIALLGGIVGGCSTPHPVVMQGDADSVVIAYGGDLASVNALARRHCARYERVPRLDQMQQDTAYFDCVRP